MARLAWIVAVLAACACHRADPGARGAADEVTAPTQPGAPARKGNDMTQDVGKDVAKRLEAEGYKGLFMTMSNKPVEEVWAQAGAAGLDAVIADPDASSKARYLAAEIRFRKDPAYRPADPAGLARAYADALREEVIANPWGMPGELDEPLGKHLVALGEPAVPALVPLLAETRAISYSGSKEATVGNEYKMRVKDFAAFFIARIRNRPLKLDVDPAVRDKVIADLQASL
jgi:hypothetical protein